MRTGKVLFAAILLCVIPFTLVNAQRAAGTLSFGGFGGVGLPMGPDEFKDHYKMGIGFGGELKYNFTEMTSLAASFTYLPFKIDEDKMIEDVTEGVEIPEGVEITIEGGSLKMSIISANLIQYFTAPAASAGFYVTAGAGYYTYSMDDVTVKVTYEGETYEETMEMDESESDLGLNGGAGLEITMGTNLFLFAEGKYHHIFSEDEATSFITIMGGLRFTP